MVRMTCGFQGERVAWLPEALIREYKSDPLISSLYIVKMGFFPRAKFHYDEEKQGANHCLLIYCTHGRGWYEIGGKRYNVEADQVFSLPSATPYAFGSDTDDPWSIYWVRFSGRLAPNFITKLGPLSILPESTSRIEDRLDYFEEIFQNFSNALTKENMIFASLYLYPFLGSFFYLTSFRRSKSANKFGSKFSESVVYYMNENLGNNLSLKDISQYFHYSVSRFTAIFTEALGEPPIRYYLKLKMKRACQYLEQTDLKMREIAEKVGYTDHSFFTRTFKSIIGISPLKYREKKRGEVC